MEERPATTTVTRLQNFSTGARRLRRGPRGARAQPGHRGGDRHDAGVGRGGRGPRRRRREAGPSRLGGHDAGRAWRALLALADRLETHADELADLEAANAGKPRLAFLEDELPFIADNLRFFAGAGRLLEGRAAGEYLERRSSIIRREPVGVVGQITPHVMPSLD